MKILLNFSNQTKMKTNIKKLAAASRRAATLMGFAAICILGGRNAVAQTPIYFNVLEMTGATNDVTINVQAVNNPTIWNGQFHWLPAAGINITTTNGMGYVSLVPGQYTASIVGMAQSWNMTVTNSQTQVDASGLSQVVTVSGVQTISPGTGISVTQSPPGTFTVSATGGGNAAIATNVLSAVVNSPVVTIISPTNYVVSGVLTNGFANSTAMWCSLTNLWLWSAFTNGPWDYPYGGSIVLEGGDMFLTNRMQFLCPTNISWAFSISSPNPMHNAIIFPQSNSWPEGLLFFGQPYTNSATENLGYFSIKNVALFAANQTNDILYVNGINAGYMTGCFGGTTNNLWTTNGGYTALAGGRQLILGDPPGYNRTFGWNLTIARFQGRADNKGIVAQDDLFNGAEYGLIEDTDHAENNNVQGGGMRGNGNTNAAVILDRANMENSFEKLHFVNDDAGVISGASMYPHYNNFDGIFGPANYVDINVGVGLVIERNDGGAMTVFGNNGAGALTIQNPGGERILALNLFWNSGSGTATINLGDSNLIGTPYTVTTPQNILDDGNGNQFLAGNTTASNGFLNTLFITNSMTLLGITNGTVIEMLTNSTVVPAVGWSTNYVFAYNNGSETVFTNNSTNAFVVYVYDPLQLNNGNPEPSLVYQPTNQIGNRNTTLFYFARYPGAPINTTVFAAGSDQNNVYPSEGFTVFQPASPTANISAVAVNAPLPLTNVVAPGVVSIVSTSTNSTWVASASLDAQATPMGMQLTIATTSTT